MASVTAQGGRAYMSILSMGNAGAAQALVIEDAEEGNYLAAALGALPFGIQGVKAFKSVKIIKKSKGRIVSEEVITGAQAAERAGAAPRSIEAKTWQEYEAGVRSLYGETSFKSREFTTFVDGKFVNGVADNVATIGGRNVAVEAKFVDDWAKSLRNPASLIGNEPFAVAEQAKMLEQARKYAAAFDEVIYHSNSPELIAHYTKVFQAAGITNFRFILTQ